SFGSIEAARRHVIEKEVESVLRESHTAQFEWFEKRLNTSLREKLDAWPTFIELTERRNLFVHNDGVVNSQYLAVCRAHNVPVPAETVEGTKLEASYSYHAQAASCLLEIGLKLGQVVWRRLC